MQKRPYQSRGSLFRTGNYAEARQELASALQLRPDYPAALANLRLVAATDGGPATPPEVVASVNLWKRLFIRFLTDEQGQDLVEYALIVAAVGLALITTVNQLSSAIVSLYSSITTGLASIGAGGA
jgi:Flp pilus assembly pilin Flp